MAVHSFLMMNFKALHLTKKYTMNHLFSLLLFFTLVPKASLLLEEEKGGQQERFISFAIYFVFPFEFLFIFFCL